MNVPNVATNGRNKYLDILNEGWALHLAPREPNAPTVISTFAGCGGSSLGYSMAGFRELLAVEWDDNAVETFKLNFPDVPVYHGDIAKLSVDQVFQMTGLKEGELDVFDGSPPCQGFSTAGKRILDDPRNELFKEYVRLLRGLKPKVFVMENVSGMVKGKMKLIFAEIMRELKASGYQVSARLMNAMYFNVPQSRQRMIFIGVREGLNIKPSHPVPSGLPVPVSSCHSPSKNFFLGEMLERWRRIPPGGNFMNLPVSLRTSAFYSNAFRRLNPNQPAMTIPKEPNFTTGTFLHWEEPRYINEMELRRIGSFADRFQFTGTFKSVHNRIGNSVPPMFMKAIAEHIRTEILNHA